MFKAIEIHYELSETTKTKQKSLINSNDEKNWNEFLFFIEIRIHLALSSG